MALRSEELKRVPWFSLAEWDGVYKEIYSNDTEQQTKGYETMLVWKSRMPKLPVGVDCTLSLLQVCLRDRDLTSKINSGLLPTYYENDLSLMYSTTVMRFLNHISNIGHTKQTSLYQIAKQLKIPEWIVNLRHDAAHGHELPVIDLLRMAANLLLSWLHDEYWKPEAEALEKSFERQNSRVEIEANDSVDGLADLIELWMSVGLYLQSNFSVVSDLPDEHLRNTLNELQTLKSSRRDLDTSVPSELDGNDYRLKSARSHLLHEISNELRRAKDPKSTGKIVTECLISSEVFLVTSDFVELFSGMKSNVSDDLPKEITRFWQPMISLLHETKILEFLTLKLIQIVKSREWDNQKRKCAALWLKLIGQSLLKLKISYKEGQKLEHSQDSHKKTPQKVMKSKLQEIINGKNESLRSAPWLALNSDIPKIFENDNFTSDLILNANDLTSIFIGPFLELISPEINEGKKRKILDFLYIQSARSDEIIDCGDDHIHTVEDLQRMAGRKEVEIVDDDDVQVVEDLTGDPRGTESQIDEDLDVHTVDDLKKIYRENMEVIDDDDDDDEEVDLGDKKIRSSSWELAPMDLNWGDCALGVLPWQLDSLESLRSAGIQASVVYPDIGDEIIPGVIDGKLRGKRVNWGSVLRKSQRGKKKKRRRADDVMDKAIQIVKSRKVDFL